MKKTTWIAGAAVLALAAGGAWWWQQRAKTDDVQYRSAKIERGNLQATVSASGIVNPVTQVSVGTQVSGQIKELYVDFNSEVKAGQLIAQIDPETFEYRVRSAQADADSAQAAVLTAQANGAASRAQVSRAQVDLIEAQRDSERQQSLVDKQFVTASVADKARALVAVSIESVKAAQAQLGVTDAQVKSALANVAQRASSLAQARIDLARTQITSPVSGIVIKRAIEKGQTVAASLQAPELFVIAQNLSDMQVDASIDESDVGRIKNGQKASFTVDAFPGQTFDGTVKQVRKAAQNVANVVTYVAVVAFTNNGGRLLPGMTANVRVVTDARQDVLKVPNAALRVRIAGVEPAAVGASGAASGAAGAASGAGPGASGASGAAPSSSFGWFSPAYAQPAAGGGFAAQRERLVTELQLTTEQQAKLDAIGAELRPQYAALRELAEDERAVAREKITTSMRSKISAMLSPEQRSKYQALLANAPARSAPSGENTPKSIANSSIDTPANSRKPSKVSDPASAAASAASASASVSASAKAAAAATSPASAPVAAPLAEFRNRLVSELQLTADQTAKVDAIYADARPQFATLRDLAPEERSKARERITADIRARIGDLLSPEQKAKYAVLQAESAGRASSRGRIYLLDANGKPVAYNVRLGITDGSSTELLVAPGSPNADLFKEGANVVIGILAPGAAGTAGAGAANGQRPGAPSGPRLPF